MIITAGVIFALIAMVGWGFGDFFIQKSARKSGDWETLFIITFFGALALTPFVYHEIPALFSFNKSLWIMFLASAILFFAALLDFEALKKGKLDVVEPIWSLEIPISAFLAFLIVRESVSILQVSLIIFLIVGLALVSFKSKVFSKKVYFEKGVFIAALAATLMGAANFFVGYGSRATNALMMNWFLNVFMAVFSFAFIIYTSDFGKMLKHFKTEKRTWLSMSIFDNIAWIAFAFSMTLSPIAITVALSESYIIIAVLLGVFVNKELLHSHQKIGLMIAIASALVLATTIA